MSSTQALSKIRAYLESTKDSAPSCQPTPDSSVSMGQVSLYGGKVIHQISVDQFGMRSFCHVATLDVQGEERRYKWGVFLDSQCLVPCLTGMLDAKKTLLGLNAMSREQWPTFPIEIAEAADSNGGTLQIRIDQYKDKLDVYLSQIDRSSGSSVKRWCKFSDRDIHDVMALILAAHDHLENAQASEEPDESLPF